MNQLASILFALLPAVLAVAPPASAQLFADIWVDESDEVFRPGERVRVGFRASESAYAAVIHIDTDGRIDLLYPDNAWDDGYVRGESEYSLSRSGVGDRYWTVGSSDGIGYLYLIVSPEPLDLRFFRGGSRGYDGFGWQRNVRGDPFWAMRNIAQILIPEWGYVPYAEDVYTYYVGRRYDYPRYACYDDGFYDRGGYYYTSCDRILVLLRQYPYYYDSHRYRGDRYRYLRDIDEGQPVHGYKERADLPQRTFTTPGDRRSIDDVTRLRPADEPAAQPARPRVERADPSDDARARPITPSRERPKLERRPPERDPSPPAEPPRSRTPERNPSPPPSRAPEPRAEPRQERSDPPPARPVRPTSRRPPAA